MLLLALLPLAAGCNQPRGTYQHATVTWVGDTACFSVADTEESRRTAPVLAAISVSRQTGGGWVDLWHWATPVATPTVLPPDRCLRYGEAPQAATSPSFAAPPLRPGERYVVEINGEVPNPLPGGDATLSRSYSRHFCILPTGQGAHRVALVQQIRGELDWSVCQASDDGPALHVDQ